MGEGERLFDTVLSNTEESPYTVEKTEEGFRLRLDIADARWWGLMSRNGLKKAMIHDIHVDEAARTLAITDSLRTVEWSIGPSLEDGLQPKLLEASAEASMGRIWQWESRKSWAFDDSGRFTKVLDYKFDASEGRDLVRGTARALGWKERRPLTVKIGLAAVIFGVSIAVICAIIAVIVA